MRLFWQLVLRAFSRARAKTGKRMAAKIPIVATDTGGIPEIIDRPVKTSDPVQLSGAIKEMLENKKLASEQIRLNSKKLTRFSLKKMVEETEKVYLELTGAPE